MTEPSPKLDRTWLHQWHKNIEATNRNNIFSHCRTCGYEWVDSSQDVPCPQCGGDRIEHVCCWQFPDG